jgi:hypothetical protein
MFLWGKTLGFPVNYSSAKIIYRVIKSKLQSLDKTTAIIPALMISVAARANKIEF